MKKLNFVCLIAALGALMSAVPALAAGPTAKEPDFTKPSFTTSIQIRSQDKHVQISSFKVASLDGEPAPIKVTRETSFVESATQNADHSWKVVPGKFWTGMNAKVTSNQRPDGKIVVSYKIDIQKLVALRDIQFDGAKIQAPDLDASNYTNTVLVENGKPVEIPMGEHRMLTLTVTRD